MIPIDASATLSVNPERSRGVDGKTLKGSYDRALGKTALHMVSAWSSQHRLVLGQVKVADKSNEITAIPALLELLNIATWVIIIDAMGTQTAIASQIFNAKADYVLALKANHPTLHAQVKDCRTYATGTSNGARSAPSA